MNKSRRIRRRLELEANSRRAQVKWIVKRAAQIVPASRPSSEEANSERQARALVV